MPSESEFPKSSSEFDHLSELEYLKELKLPESELEYLKKWNLERLFNDLNTKKESLRGQVTDRYKQYIILYVLSYSFSEIAKKLFLTPQYVRSFFSSTIYPDIQMLTEIERVDERRLYRVLVDRYYNYHQTQHNHITFPHGYIKRGKEEQICGELKKDGALIQIKGLKNIGKTLLLDQIIIPEAQKEGYKTVSLSCDRVNTSHLTDMEKLLKWFCKQVTRNLNLELRIDEYWDQEDAPNINASNYLEKILISIEPTVLMIALDNLDYIFDNLVIATDFCALLRGCFSESRANNSNSYLWKRLRLVILYSREKYAQLDIHSSPLYGVGYACKLDEFDSSQVREFTSQYQVDWSNDDIKKLLNLVGGHPDLIDRAFKESETQNLTPDRLLRESTTESGIYADHLRQLLKRINDKQDLKTSFKEVITSPNPIRLSDANGIFQLESMGIVKLKGDLVIPRCELYRQYFSDRI